jgi:hypothetical protein
MISLKEHPAFLGVQLHELYGNWPDVPSATRLSYLTISQAYSNVKWIVCSFHIIPFILAIICILHVQCDMTLRMICIDDCSVVGYFTSFYHGLCYVISFYFCDSTLRLFLFAITVPYNCSPRDVLMVATCTLFACCYMTRLFTKLLSLMDRHQYTDLSVEHMDK